VIGELERKLGAKITRARTQLGVASRTKSRERIFFEPAASEKHTFSRVTAAKPATTKKGRELGHTRREPDFGSSHSRNLHGRREKNDL